MLRPLIQCVVVVYRKAVADCAALRSLAELCSASEDIAGGIRLLVYDNSPVAQPFSATFPGLEGWASYQHNGDNPGLSAAYNAALVKAEGDHLRWLLLLDQDTAITESFLVELSRLTAADTEGRICAYVPKLSEGGNILSPQRIGLLRKPAVPADFAGCSREKLTAFNSGACLRVQAVQAMGGFPADFPLDYLDHIVFHRLQQAGGTICVLDIRLEHRHSLADIEREMSVQRYAGLLRAEWRYVRESCGCVRSLFHRLHLLKRGLLQLLQLRNKSFARLTFRAMWERHAEPLGAPMHS